MKSSDKVKKNTITVPANKKNRHVMKLMNFFRVIVIPFFWLLMPFRLYGNKKVKDGPCIYVSNHYRIWDVIYIAATTTEGVHYLSKKEVLDNKIVGYFCHKLKVIPVNRDGKDIKAIMDALRCLKNQEKIAIYPEGTRNKTDAEMLPLKSGATVLSIRSKTPIIPVMLYKKPKLFRMAHILVGEPLEFSEYYGKKITEEDIAEADEKLRNCLLNMRKEHKEFLENKKKRG